MTKGTLLNYNKQTCGPQWQVDGAGDCFHRIYYMYAGDVTYTSAHLQTKLRPNHLYILPANTPYHLTHHPAHPFEVLWFHLSCPYALVSALVAIPIAPDSAAHHLLQGLAASTDKDRVIIEKILEALLLVLEQDYPLKKTAMNATESIVHYIHEHLAEDLSNEQLAQLVGYNKNYMIKKFKVATGLAPRQYVIKVKMSYGKQYLAHGKSVKEVADLLGYKDANVFSRDFKKYDGQNPSYYIGHTIP
ncbi:MAG: helix-turn-helix domain-containing protein [Cellulosilyticaceae bacterium]